MSGMGRDRLAVSDEMAGRALDLLGLAVLAAVIVAFLAGLTSVASDTEAAVYGGVVALEALVLALRCRAAADEREGRA